VFFILLAAAVPGAWAQSGAIRGKVIGPDSRAMAGVTVQLRNDITGFNAETDLLNAIFFGNSRDNVLNASSRSVDLTQRFH
jgi:hypothetical protein